MAAARTRAASREVTAASREPSRAGEHAPGVRALTDEAPLTALIISRGDGEARLESRPASVSARRTDERGEIVPLGVY